MSLLDQQNFLARLFTDEKFRHDFRADPEKSGKANGLDAADILFIKAISEKDLNFFADSLFHKRLNEVEKLLPLSADAFGKKKFRAAFKEFSNVFLPSFVKKHLEDAIEYTKYLLGKGEIQGWQKDVVVYEQAKLLFHGAGKRFVFRIMRHSLFTATGKLRENPPKRLTLLIWARAWKWARHYRI